MDEASTDLTTPSTECVDAAGFDGAVDLAAGAALVDEGLVSDVWAKAALEVIKAPASTTVVSI
jgi:hypothetical protein